ncbi:MAG: hypothetical protein ACLQVI_35505 [Polyangiaceae bacterium]
MSSTRSRLSWHEIARLLDEVGGFVVVVRGVLDETADLLDEISDFVGEVRGLFDEMPDLVERERPSPGRGRRLRRGSARSLRGDTGPRGDRSAIATTK